MRKRDYTESDMYLYKYPYIYRAICLRIGLYAGVINRLLHAPQIPYILPLHDPYIAAAWAVKDKLWKSIFVGWYP
jgi:hypothetical protein